MLALLLKLSNPAWDFISLLATIALGAIAFADDIANHNPRYLFFVKNILFKIAVVAIGALTIWWTNGGKEDNSEDEKSRQNIIAIKQRDSVSDLNLHRIDSMTHNQIDSTNKGLKIVGLRIDTTKQNFGKLVQVVRDSAKKTTLLKNIQAPELTFDSIKLKINKGNDKVLFAFKVRKSMIYNFRVLAYPMVMLNGKFVKLTQPFNIFLKSMASEYVGLVTYPVIYQNYGQDKSIFWHITGNYKDSQGDITNIDEIFIADEQGNLSSPSGETYDYYNKIFIELFGSK